MGAAPSDKQVSHWQAVFAKWLTGNLNAKNEQRGYCPIHEDPDVSGTPSASFNFAKSVFYCNSSCGGMSFTNLKKSIEEDLGEPLEAGDTDPAPAPRRSRVRTIDDAPSKRGKTKPLPTEEKIQEWVDALLASPGYLKTMETKRGLTPETIERFQIGWCSAYSRYSIPIRDADGVLVNVRLYDPEASEPKDKMRSWGNGGHGSRRIYGLEALDELDEVVITEGEMDRILGVQEGLPCITHTAGATAWNSEWNPLFEGKTVFFCYDRDKTGEEGALKGATQVAKFAESVYIVRLPGDAKGFDLTDYLTTWGGTAGDFKALMDESRKNPVGRKAKQSARVTKDAVRVTLESSMSSEHGRDPIEVVATIAGKVQPSYMLPKRVDYTCDGSYGDKCKRCPVQMEGYHKTAIFDSHEEVLLEFINQGSDTVRKRLLKEVGAPTACPVVDVEQTEQWNVEELILIPSVDDRTQEAQSPITRKAYNVGEFATPVNTTAKVIGVNTTDPKNQRAILQTWDCEQTQTDLDRFAMTPEIRKALTAFQVQGKETPLERMRAISRDLSLNVTRIYGRTELHLAYDVVWHSVLDFNFTGKPVGKGWIELLVVGDTRTGKSEASLQLSNHYRAGILKSCEGATLAGLVGGAQQIGNSWMVTWGTIPLNDRRLVILDEFSGIAEKNVIEQMSSIRSSGRAQITKIVSQETSARTRLIWISNPIDGRAMNEHGLGAIEAIRGLVKNPEDIARFDIAISAARSDVDSSVINSTDHEHVKHRYTSDLCSQLVAWAWSRKPEQIVWEEDVEEFVLETAESFGNAYVPEPPLVQAENVRVKLARISVAIAARTFSTDETGELLVVGQQHVEAAVELLDTLYGMESFGYKAFSRKVLRDRDMAVKRRKQCYRYLVQEDGVRNTLMSVLGQNFKLRDFQEFGGMQQAEAQQATTNLQQMKMVERKDKGYMKMTPALIEVLKRLESELDE
jgi:hypothetical protein